MTAAIGFKDTDRKTSELLEDILHSIQGEHILYPRPSTQPLPG